MKQSGNKAKVVDIFVPKQAYHMDLTFVSGLSNLEDIRTSLDKENVTVKQSRGGYIGFLMMVDGRWSFTTTLDALDKEQRSSNTIY